MLKFRCTRLPLARLIGLGVLTLAGLNAPLQAQEGDTSGGWYQIEVILFTHEDSQDDETSRNDVSLTYPANWVELKDPNSVAAQAQLREQTPPRADGALADPDSAAGDTLTESATDAAAQDAPTLPDIASDPFYTLPGNLRELNRQADALKRSRSHRLLFHEAWRQPVRATAAAPSVVIFSGERYDDHQELEGSLTVSVSRYLHLSTNLWLTEFTRNSGSDAADNKSYWPELPPRPAQKQVQLSLPNILSTDDGTSGYSLETGSSAWDRALQLDDSYDFTPGVSRAYVPAQISTLQQQRRMRSGEVHYIDHPRISMVILVTPYEVPR